MYQSTTPPQIAPRGKHAVSEAEIMLRRILKSGTQDLWLDTIRRTKGPQHNSIVHWMLGQTECDFAIAANAFYRSNPAKYLETAHALPARPGPQDIFAQILLNWETGSYRAHRLQVQAIDADPRLVAQLGEKLAARAPTTLPFAIPQQFLHPSGGKVMHLPAHQSPETAPHLWPIYSALGLDVPSAPPGIKRWRARVRDMLARVGLRRSSMDN